LLQWFIFEYAIAIISLLGYRLGCWTFQSLWLFFRL
jgi:hypothetical protein